MKMNSIKLMSFSAVLMACVTGSVQAAPAGTIVTKTADIVFAATGAASLSLTPVQNLAGKYTSTVLVANGTASSSAGKVAIRMTPGTYIADGITGDVTVGNFFYLSGKSNPKNQIQLMLANNVEHSQGDFTRAGTAIVDGEWFYSNTASDGADKKFVLATFKPTNNIVADTYVASVDAVTWTD